MLETKDFRALALAIIILVVAVLGARPVWPAGSAPRAPAALAAELRQPQISGEFAVVIDGANGDILYDKGAHVRVPPASLTKIATAIVAIENGRLGDRIPIDFDSYQMVVDSGASIMGLKPGDNPSLEDLLYGLMLPSGADAAVAIARHVAGSEARFVEMMDERVRSLGLQNTNFANTHGLDAPDHYSSAYDMAALSRYGMRNATFRSLAATTKYEVKSNRSYELWNLNRLLYSYDGADGVKIGYTEKALETIVASATRDGMKLIVAVMRSNSRYVDAAVLLDYYFDALAKGQVTRTPAVTATPTPTSTSTRAPTPTATATPTPTPAVEQAIQPTPTPSTDFWSGLADAIGSTANNLLRAIGLGR